MLVLLLLYSLILFVLAYPLLPVSWVGIIAFGGSALLATWTYLWGYQRLYHQSAPQEPYELLALPLEPLRQYLKGVKLPRFLLYAILAVAIYIFLARSNQALVSVWPEGRCVATQLEQDGRGGADDAHRGVEYRVVSPHRRGADADCRGTILPRGTHGVDDAETLSTLERHPPSCTTFCRDASQPRGHAADLLSCAPAGLPALGYGFALAIGRATHV